MESPLPSASSSPLPQNIQQRRQQQHTSRLRAASLSAGLAHSNIDAHGAICKQSPALSRARSISTTQPDRLYALAASTSSSSSSASPPLPITSAGLHWPTPPLSISPQPQPFSGDVSCIEQFSEWGLPTPPRSDSSAPSAASLDAREDIITTAALHASPELATFDMPAVTTETSSLDYLLPSYGAGVLDSDPTFAMDNFIAPGRMSQSHATSAPMATSLAALSSSPSLYASHMTPVSDPEARRVSEAPSHTSLADSTFGADFARSMNFYSSPATTAADFSLGPSQAIPALSGMSQPLMGSPHIGAIPIGPSYDHALSRSSSIYDPSIYAPAYTPALSSSMPTPAPAYANLSQPGLSWPPPFIGSSVNEMQPMPGAGSPPGSIRVVNQRPKPQCWEHGCNGRQFSTFSNLLRHQREKSGTAAKAYCPTCGAEFTRTTARNGHLAHGKCTRGGDAAATAAAEGQQGRARANSAA